MPADKGGRQMDEIRIDNLEVYAYHGVYPEETQNGQPFFINAVLYTDTRAAGQKDDLKLATNYGEVCRFMNQFMKDHTYRLIEAAAENLARELLQEFSLIDSLDLEIRKPKAPIGLPFESVSVKINRGWHTAYVAFGSNMGDKEKHINNGLLMLNASPGIRVVRASEIMHSEPYGGVEQEDFLNGAVKLQTYLSPWELLEALHKIEAEEERERSMRWGPRTLDLDIIFYDDLVMEKEELCIPHTDMQNREFVLVPLMELAPEKRHPVFGKSVQEMLMELKKENGS